MKDTRIRWTIHTLLLAVSVMSCMGCRQLPTLFDNRRSIPAEAPLSKNSVLQPLSSEIAIDSDAIETEEYGSTLSLKYRDLLFAALLNFRHSSGLHEVRFAESISAADCEDRMCVLLPPGLNRLQQIEFLQELEKYIASFRNACHQYVCARRLDEIAHRETVALEELSVASQKRFEQKEIGWLEMEQVQSLIDQSKAKTLQRSLGQTAVPTSDHALRMLLHFLDTCDSDAYCAANWTNAELVSPTPAITHSWLTVETPTQNVEYQKKKLEYLILQRQDRSRSVSPRWFECWQSKRVVSRIPNSAHDMATSLECQLKDQLRIAKEKALAAAVGSELISQQVDASKARTQRVAVALVAGEATRMDQLKAELQSLAMQTNLILHTQYQFSLFDEWARLQGSLFSIERISFPNCWLQPVTMEQARESTRPEMDRPYEQFED